MRARMGPGTLLRTKVRAPAWWQCRDAPQKPGLDEATSERIKPMKPKSNLVQVRLGSGVLGMLCLVLPGQARGGATPVTPEGPPADRAEAIPWSQLVARVGADY